MQFIHLHTHSEYSFHAGVPKVKELVAAAKACGMPALALTDTNRMSGLVDFHLQCMEAGMKPVLGVELTDPKHSHEYVVALAKNKNGYADLCEIITERQLHPETFAFDKLFAKEYSDLFLITASPRVLRELAATPNAANLYAELLHLDPASRDAAKKLRLIAQQLGVPLVAANNVHFLARQDWETHRILSAIGHCSTLSRLRPEETVPDTAYFCNGEEMAERFSGLGEALVNAARIAGQCSADLELGNWIFPKISVPDGFTPEQYLEKIAREGLERRYGSTPSYGKAKEIQEKELAVINKLGFASYFLMVKQVRDWANGRYAGGLRRPTDCTLMRGSAANSITFYNIGASDLDPVRYNLYFERFLNEDRASPPDADLDFGWDERDAAFDYFVNTWGRDRVAVLATVNHMRRRAAFREVAKVFGYSEEQVTGLLDRYSLPQEDPDIQRVLAYANKVRGKPRFLGQHPGGIIVTNDPVWRHVACEYSGGVKNRVITQIDMHSGIDELGLIKFDILGNGSLSVLRDTLCQIEEQGHDDPRVWNADVVQNDPTVLDMIEKGRTRGIFYIESPAQMKLNRQALARSFEEIGITSSAVRPAGARYTKLFVERHRKMKQGIVDWKFVHPSLTSILDETHDCIVYQEDVVKICHDIAGMSYKRADRVRKMMNSQHDGVPDDYETVAMEFVDGCKHTSGLTGEQAIELWERVNSFTGFSFCKSHSLSYAMLSFKCTYLKAHYPAQFMASVISNLHGFYSQDTYINEARRLGIKINPIHVNTSRVKCVGKGRFLSVGLMHVKGVFSRTIQAIVDERDAHGPYKNLADFIRRVGAGKSDMEKLIKVGCFDGFNMSRPELLALLDAAYGRVREADGDLFGGLRFTNAELHPGLSEYCLTQKCMHELEHLGFMLSGNILDILDLHPESRGAVLCGDVGRYAGSSIKVFGWPITSRVHPVPGRGDMKFITIEDKSGCADIVMWPDVYARYADVTVRPGPFAISGCVKEQFGVCAVFAKSIRSVEWSPSIVDFELASKRLMRSYNEEFVYGDAVKAA
ncbi:MAG TPA: DNA polymerase III subunit alpha [Chitinivibrionales bacterium]|nr:DNA polymerase III subunit alpha [Chitinivibrionales bacterium]